MSTNERGWCQQCGVGNKRLGFAHLPGCPAQDEDEPPLRKTLREQMAMVYAELRRLGLRPKR